MAKSFKQFISEAWSPTKIALPSQKVYAIALRAAKSTAAQYKRYETAGKSVPSAPDSSKFRATVSGMVEVGPVTIHQSFSGLSHHYQVFIKIGSAIESKKAKEIRDDFLGEFDDSLDNAIDGDVGLKLNTTYECSDGKRFTIGTTDGSNWGGIGVRFL